MAESIPTILVLDDEETMLRILRRALEAAGYRVEAFSDPTDALARLQEGGIDLVVTDLMMERLDGFAVLTEALALDPEMVMVVITAFSSIESAVKAMQMGAYDFIPKPFDPEHLVMVVRRGMENRRLRRENEYLRQELTGRDSHLDRIVGSSAALQHLKAMIGKIRESDGTVLILGESGVGKELVARAIHAGSRRSARRLVPINCGALPDELLESELFGYEKGAFSGAATAKMGLLQLADGGTLFFDEVGTISPMMQVKLLRFLEDKRFMRLGGREEITVDVRVLAATNENLEEKVRQGTFRKDLYYRLNVITIEVPPLRERREDIPLLCRYFLENYAERTGRPLVDLAADAEARLAAAPWEGNIRELQNCIERAVTLIDKPLLTAADLRLAPGLLPAGGSPETAETLATLDEVEARHIELVLERTYGNKSQAAKILGIDYTTLLRKLKGMRDAPAAGGRER